MPHAIATFTNEIYEQEPGKLGDREGAFVLQHYGTISSEGSEIAGAVVPGSGTGELDGLSGEGTIAVDAEGNHRLILDYELEE